MKTRVGPFTAELSTEQAKYLEHERRFFEGPEGGGVRQLRALLLKAKNDPLISKSQSALEVVELVILLIEEANSNDVLAGEIIKPLAVVLEEEGVRKFLSRMAARKHQNNRKATAQIPSLWATLKAQGKSKNEAAPLIASQVHLSESRVRKLLQGK